MTPSLGWLATNNTALTYVSSSLAANTWYFFVGRIDGSGHMDIWINGNEVASTTGITYQAATKNTTLTTARLLA